MVASSATVGTFLAPATCAWVPATSSVISSPRISTATRIRTARAGAVGGELRLEVADAFLRRAGVEEDHAEQAVLDAASSHEAGDGQPQAVLQDADRVSRLAARHPAADVG